MPRQASQDRKQASDAARPSALPVAGAPPRERKDAARNRQRILHAARELLAEQGPEGLTMTAVAARAGVGKGTVFRRFGDREGLAEALIDEPMRTFQAHVLAGPPPLGPGAAPTARLEAFITAFVRLCFEHFDVVITASEAPGHRRSAPYAFLLLHGEILLRQIGEVHDPALSSRLLLGAVSVDVLREARAHGADADAVTAAAIDLLRGLTSSRSE